MLFYIFSQTETEHINLKVLGQDNAVVQFKIKKHTPLRKLMNAYCDRAVSVPFLFQIQNQISNSFCWVFLYCFLGPFNASGTISLRWTTDQ